MPTTEWEDWTLLEASLEASLQEDWKNRTISNLQLETVIYSMQRFQGPRLDNGHRAGFFLGDGAGVGKGRQIAALIKEMWLKGAASTLRCAALCIFCSTCC